MLLFWLMNLYSYRVKLYRFNFAYLEHRVLTPPNGRISQLLVPILVIVVKAKQTSPKVPSMAWACK